MEQLTDYSNSWVIAINFHTLFFLSSTVTYLSFCKLFKAMHKYLCYYDVKAHSDIWAAQKKRDRSPGKTL